MNILGMYGKRLRHRLALALISFMATVSAVEISLRVVASRRLARQIEPSGLLEHSREFGWIPVPNGKFRHRERDFDVTYHTDEERTRRTPFNANEKPVIGIYGDSFAWGVGVEDGETFASYLRKFISRGKVRNSGVNGYALDQYYLRFREDIKSPTRRPDVAIFAIYPGNDIEFLSKSFVPSRDPQNPGKVILRAKPLLSRESKNVFLVFPDKGRMDGRMDSAAVEGYREWIYGLVKQVQLFQLVYHAGYSLPWLGDFIAQSQSYLLHPDRNEFKEAMWRFEWVVEKISGTSIPTLFLLVPGMKYATVQPTHRAFEDFLYNAARQLLREKKVLLIDLREKEFNKKEYYHVYDGHFSRKGNEIVARILYDSLTKLGMLEKIGISQQMRSD